MGTRARYDIGGFDGFEVIGAVSVSSAASANAPGSNWETWRRRPSPRSLAAARNHGSVRWKRHSGRSRRRARRLCAARQGPFDQAVKSSGRRVFGEGHAGRIGGDDTDGVAVQAFHQPQHLQPAASSGCKAGLGLESRGAEAGGQAQNPLGLEAARKGRRVRRASRRMPPPARRSLRTPCREPLSYSSGGAGHAPMGMRVHEAGITTWPGHGSSRPCGPRRRCASRAD